MNRPLFRLSIVLAFAATIPAQVAPEPFPNRVIFITDFDTGPKEKYWPGEFSIIENPPSGANLRAAKSVPHPNNANPFIRLGIEPVRPVGARTKLRFKYHLAGATALTVQVFDATVQDNRHVRLTNLVQGRWTLHQIDFARDSKRNDGSAGSFTAGNLIDDLFFFVEGEMAKGAILHIDEVILYDAAP